MNSIKPQDSLVKTNEVLLKDNGQWLYFSEPQHFIAAHKLADVLPALQEVERMVETHHLYAAGFLSYEAASAFGREFQTHASAPRARQAFPYLWFGLYSKPRTVSLTPPGASRVALDWQPATDRATYQSAIARIKNQIADGRTYQVNYTMRLETKFGGSAWNFFLRLARHQNNHAAYIDIGRYVVCSASPELFFQLDGQVITCRPMKGTAKRGRITDEDRRQAQWLRNSEKNRAENVMIVDMVRNDLGRIAETGSVQVPDLFSVERYPTLWQMTSTVTARTRASVTEIFRALFPCASITGAPKVSTMRIISELETMPRRVYTGSIGYISPNREAKFNVAIRTALIDRATGCAEYGVGGGIVWDSIETEEYTEALLKGRVLTEDPGKFSLLETMLWTPEGGYFLREKHLARLLDSASYFGVPISREVLDGCLDQAAHRFRSARRVRLLVEENRIVNLEWTSHTPEETDRPLRVHLAKEPVSSKNLYLFHKTTRREVYESARKEYPDFDDVLLYNQTGELTEFTIGNLVVELDGKMLTPPIFCGVLAGTFRARLLETGQIQEGIIPIKQLESCTRIFRVNSVHRWQRVEITG